MTSVSVIVPAYNAARTLRETVSSIAAQTVAVDEIIVVDDGSTDETAAIAGSVKGVRLVRQANTGPAAALNAGLGVASGTVFGFLDADDVWTSDAVATQLENLARHPDADASVGWVEEFVCPSLDEATAGRFRPRPPQVGFLSGATFVRAESFGRAGSFDPDARLWPWIDWGHRAKLAGLNFATVDHVILKRRLHPASLSMRQESKGGASLIGAARRALQRHRLVEKPK